jgi:hypothetical protein
MDRVESIVSDSPFIVACITVAAISNKQLFTEPLLSNGGYAGANFAVVA